MSDMHVALRYSATYVLSGLQSNEAVVHQQLSLTCVGSIRTVLLE